MKKIEVFLLILFISFLVYLSFNFYNLPYRRIYSMDESRCPLEYGGIECFYNKSLISFYNPNNLSLKLVNLEVSQDDRTVIYNINKNINFNKTGYIFFGECGISTNQIRLRWSCQNNTYEINLDEDFAKEFEIKEIGEEDFYVDLPTTTSTSSIPTTTTIKTSTTTITSTTVISDNLNIGDELFVKAVDYMGSEYTGSRIKLICEIEKFGDDINYVGLWVGKFNKSCENINLAESYNPWILNNVSMKYNSANGHYEYDWVVDVDPAEIIGATCRAYDLFGVSSNWGDSYPLFEVGKERYPIHPTPEDCENLETPVINFCYADVAEISGNITYCQKIWDPDIKIFCTSKLQLNEKKCKYIKDDGLREECFRSIEQKKEWLGV